MKVKINNRRYIGCKTKLLDFIYDSVIEFGFTNENSFADIFAGTGSVADRFAKEGFRVILNDTLYSNYVIYNAFFSDGNVREDYLLSLLESYNSIDSSILDNNYFSEIYGDKYFNVNDAKKIGKIRDLIESIRDKLSNREYFYLVASLIYATDKIANTVGHFESFLNRLPEEKGVFLKPLDIYNANKKTEIYNLDANVLSRKLNSDICYIDPPYNARQYVNFYHVLENLARWNKPTEFEGKSMKFIRNELKSDYCRKKAPILFEDLINNLNCKLIVVSYNNTYKANSVSSINTISEEQILLILNKKGRTTKKEISYKPFNAGKTDFKGHKEYLFLCEVGK